MLSKSKGDDINDTLKGPVGLFGMGLMLIFTVVAIANDWDSELTPPDNPILFGGFLANLIYELKYYMFAIVPLAIVGGGIMMAVQLTIHTRIKSKGD